MAQRKHYLFVCTNSRPAHSPKGSCATSGAMEVHAALKDGVRLGGLAQVEARVCTSSCLDACWVGPVVAVEPDGYFYGRVKVEDVPEIIESLKNGTRVERLVLPAKDYDEATAEKR